MEQQGGGSGVCRRSGGNRLQVDQDTLHAARGALHTARGALHAARDTLHAAGDGSPDIRAAGQRRRGPHEAYCKAGNDKIVA
ncbi:hypothetical protein CIK87_04190 [Prevotella sp. P5-64]|nr:hypothetical protein CIK87_04190 [Prevotella sp. P5-64]